MDKLWGKHCCNPLNKESHWVTKNLRNVTTWMTGLNYNIENGMRICTSCRLELSKKKHRSSSESDLTVDELLADESNNVKPGCSKNIDDPKFIEVDTGLYFLNASLTSIGESPVEKAKCNTNMKYCKDKLVKVKTKLNETFFQNVHTDDNKH